MDKEKIMKAVTEILEAVGENPERAGLKETPRRVADMYAEMFSGLTEDPEKHLKFFEEKSNDEMVIVRDIPFSSMCEHHLLPFVGKAHIAYIPNGNKIIGLSKIARIVDNFAKRPQVQERLTHDIADFLYKKMDAKGVAVIIEAEHMCMSIRGAKASGSKTQTSALRGNIRSDARTRAEALALLDK
ncbi:MAG TPA: GTP cyclohydrolase I FolE [Candidatus Eubacterium faecavium]|nr:GTP cyclohydrolase I FolE [Candidatus Eubacterium faecavium]